ncbi:MAG: L,D-transpeptidase [Firmicutes bacterium]|nr:L,D-transpeptidase [Bacillota bacterium]
MRYFQAAMLIFIILTVILIILYLKVPKPPELGTAIVINKAINRLYLYQDGQLIHIYSVATGKEIDLTPEGDFRIIVKEANDDGLGFDHIFGVRWMGLKTPDAVDGLKYGIHGTNEPSSIGRHVTAGCIRMSGNDIKELYDIVPIGTLVRINRGSFIHWHFTDLLHYSIRLLTRGYEQHLKNI